MYNECICIESDELEVCMVTQMDIAREAGVSGVTVSNVINGNHHKVSEENIKKIQALIEKYHYVPNATARSLAKKESRIIGVVIPNVDENDNFLKSPYNAEVLGVLERIVRAKGYYLMVRCVGSCQEIIPMVATWNVDGVVFLSAFRDDVIEIKKSMTLPMVFIDTYTKDLGESSVEADDYKGGYLVGKYLLSMGHRDILFAGPEVNGDSVIPRRFKGYKAAMAEYGVEDMVRWQYAPFTTYECGIECGRQIASLEKVPTAVFASADILALGIIEGLRISGKRIPEDVSIVGYDNLPEGQYSYPQLTSVSQQITQKAELAAKQLFRQITKKDAPIKNVEVDVEIIERHSVKRML